MSATDKNVPRKPTPQPSADRSSDDPAPLKRPPEEAPDESALESLGRAVTAPMRDAAEDEERKQTGER